MKRRTFLGGALLAPMLPKIALAEGSSSHTLVAAMSEQQLLPEGYAPTEMMTFNGSLPGPTLRVPRGQTLDVRLDNQLEEGTAVHWHGIRLANEMDGVPILTQGIVNPGEQFRYRFTAPDAGTFWYHSHYNSHEQVARGLMGPLIVEEATPPDVDQDITVLISDWLLEKNGALVENFGNMHDIAHGGRLGNYARALFSATEVTPGQRLRLRLINTAADRIFSLELGGVRGRVVALDGMALSAPRPLETLLLAPAQRADLIVDVQGEVTLHSQERGNAYLLGTLTATKEAIEPRSTPIGALPAPELPALGEPKQALTLSMLGGAMRRHKGNNIWSFNSVSDLQPVPFAAFARGETATIDLVNDTAFPHGIHLHGHHFHELNEDGSPGDLRDTSFVAAGESRKIICRFDNPGKWMLHCHMLSHQVGGMKTWVKVA